MGRTRRPRDSRHRLRRHPRGALWPFNEFTQVDHLGELVFATCYTCGTILTVNGHSYDGDGDDTYGNTSGCGPERRNERVAPTPGRNVSSVAILIQVRFYDISACRERFGWG